MVTTTLRFARVNTTFLLIHDHRSPSEQDWSAYVKAYAEAATDHGVRRLLVVSEGGGPSAAQRKEVISVMFDALGDTANEIRTAICTNSVFARGITTAIGWMLGASKLRSFEFQDRDRALAFLDVPSEQRPEILAKAASLLSEMQEIVLTGRPPLN